MLNGTCIFPAGVIPNPNRSGNVSLPARAKLSFWPRWVPWWRNAMVVKPFEDNDWEELSRGKIEQLVEARISAEELVGWD